MDKRKAVIVGAGPAGLTAAYKLLEKTDIIPVIYEQTSDIGGISKTVNYKGNRIDIGGHRFFSKSDTVMQFWQNIFPVQGQPAKDDFVLGRDVPISTDPDAPDPEKTDEVLLVRNRVSRIFYLRKFFDYPVSLSFKTIRNLGLFRIFKIGLSYIKASIFPIKEEKSLEDFLINRFGKELYNTFFRDYTKKVWGISCDQIKPEWGSQRIKGLSIRKALWQAMKNLFSKDSSIEQKTTETSLITQFLYPKYGPGQIWERVADMVTSKGGRLYLNHEVTGLKHENKRIVAVMVKNKTDNSIEEIKADYLLSTMPVKDLIAGMDPPVDEKVQKVAKGLIYRDFITVGLLLKRLKITNETKIKTVNNIIPDNWIYIQERDVKIGRLQIFNNWSPYMVSEESTVWIGLEYFCSEGDELWEMPESDLVNLAIDELVKIDIIDREDVLDSTIIKMPKTYPAYYGSYDEFNTIRDCVDKIENLFLMGRNGMHKYNNQDHSMLTAITAVDNIAKGIKSKENIWQVNTEMEYHEQK